VKEQRYLRLIGAVALGLFAAILVACSTTAPRSETAPGAVAGIHPEGGGLVCTSSECNKNVMGQIPEHHMTSTCETAEGSCRMRERGPVGVACYCFKGSSAQKISGTTVR
jgi:hypothetical protein